MVREIVRERDFVPNLFTQLPESVMDVDNHIIQIYFL